ncbi:Na/Pi cotransporter family protein [Mycoplasmatota bacterium]|nr:Na/Pi cotransporter family protein [Mycoplasmatota bacterium]
MFQNILDFISKNDFLDILFGLIGGLGIFLYGINLMGESLKTIAGDKMKNIIEKLTNNVLMGILLGILVTAIIQSSSGTTALAISLIRAGLMTMPQAVGIIMGSNIGTTVTAFLFSFPKISEFSLLFIGVGAILIFFFKNKRTNHIGQVILGFGLLFYGMDLMSKGLKTLATTDAFSQFMLKFTDNPFLGLITGAIVTAVVQSSSATTGIVQSLYDSGAINIKGALPILLGNNIGTTITAVIAALGGSIAAKRAASFHVLFNFFGAILFMIILTPFNSVVVFLKDFTNASPRLTIAYAHLIFNVCNTLLLIWFVNYIITFIKKMIPSNNELDESFNIDVFNERIILESPILALESTKNVILHMGKIVQKMLDLTLAYSKHPNSKTLEEAKQHEAIINTLDHKIHEYLVKIAPNIDEAHSTTLSKYLDTIRDLERIGDHCENILEISEYMHDNKGYLTDDARADLDLMFNTVISMLKSDLEVIDKNDKILASKVIEIEDNVDRLEKKARKRHTMRVNECVCTSEAGFNFIEVLSNLERIGDHCCNIAEYAINDEYYVIIDEKQVDLTTIPQSEPMKINIQSIENKKTDIKK